MSTKTFSVKITPDQIEYINKTLNNTTEIYPDIQNKGEALIKVFNIYNEKKQDLDDIYESEIKRVKDTVNCDYLKYAPTDGFYCNEFFFSKKKSMPIAFNPLTTIERCSDCRKGKYDERQRYIERMLTKDALDKIMNLYKSLTVLTSSGLKIQCYCCKYHFFVHGTLYFTDKNLMLPCYVDVDELEEDPKIVNVESICLETMNPDTLKKPCKHLVDLLLEGQPIEIEDLVRDFTESMPELPRFERPKQVDSDQIEKDEDTQEY